MGGGSVAAMRAAGKLTGMGVFNGGLRGGISAAQPAEQALRNVSRPAAAVVSTDTPSVADVAAIQKASWEANWDFAPVEEDLRVESSPGPIARVVFDVPPTLQEAKDATADLKEAIVKVYGPAVGLPLLAISDNPEYGPDSKLASSVPSSVFNAFKFFCERPDVQSVVASVVADQKVWDDDMENQELKEFMLSQRNSESFLFNHLITRMDLSIKELVTDAAVENHFAEDGKTADTEGYMNKFFQKVKKSVVYVKKSVIDMVSNAPDIFQKFLLAERTSADAGGAGGIFNEKTMGISVMGLAIMVIIMVLLKRV